MLFSARSALLLRGILLSLLAGALVALFSLASPANAQGNAYPTTPNGASPNFNPDVKQNQHTYVQAVMIEVLAAAVCQLTGIDPIDKKNGCLQVDPITQKLGYQKDNSGEPQLGGLLGMSSHMIGTMYNMPFHSSDYVRYLAENFGATKKTLAQENINQNPADPTDKGEGFVSLNPVLDLWTSFRNLAYLLLVIVFVFIGLGIMLRINIDPRTVMTLQNQIPKVIIGILLITFSYAISGLAVDAMWLGTYAGVNVLTQEPLCDNPNKPFTTVATNNLNNPIGFMTDLLGDETGCFDSWDGISGLSTELGFTFGDIISRTILEIVGFDAADIGDCTVGFSLQLRFWEGTDVSGCPEYIFFNIVKFFVGIAAILIIGIAILVALLRIWFALLKAYVRVILYVIFAPLWIIAGLIPGNSLGFSGWLRVLIANLAVFPATVFILVLASRFAANDQLNSADNIFYPPLVGNPNFGTSIGLVIAFGLIMLAPEMINMLRDALKSPASKYGGAVGKGIALGAAAPGGGAEKVFERVFRRDASHNPIGSGAVKVDQFGKKIGNAPKRLLRWTRERRT